jgi:hypothetical protein
MKGMSLPLETVVLLILATIVLAALLGFFLGAFTPSQSEADMVRQQLNVCQEIARRGCYTTDATTYASGSLTAATTGAKAICNSDRPACSPIGSQTTPIKNCIKSCCSVFCP